jgi:hypothetical protein
MCVCVFQVSISSLGFGPGYATGAFDLSHLKAIIENVMDQPHDFSSGALLHLKGHVFLIAKVSLSLRCQIIACIKLHYGITHIKLTLTTQR